MLFRNIFSFIPRQSVWQKEMFRNWFTFETDRIACCIAQAVVFLCVTLFDKKKALGGTSASEEEKVSPLHRIIRDYKGENQLEVQLTYAVFSIYHAWNIVRKIHFFAWDVFIKARIVPNFYFFISSWIKRKIFFTGLVFLSNLYNNW